MNIQRRPPLHLTYCLNIHPGETWAENFAAIRDKTLAVRARVCPDKPFGLGLRLSARAATELADPSVKETFRQFLAENRLYIITINGFPYGRFHGTKVKEQVYQPDWRSPDRLRYTRQLADLLADLLPPETDGSISTVPCSFKPWITQPSDIKQMVEQLMEMVAHLAALHEATGREIHLGLEPEPGCYLETTAETLRFFQDSLFRAGRDILKKRLRCGADDAENLIRRHLGICLDTCHLAIQFEELAESVADYQAAGIRISKVHLSAALKARVTPASLAALQPFCESVYLHQVKARTARGAVLGWNDLPQALAELPCHPEAGEIRVHFHIPLFFEGAELLGTTATGLTPVFFAALKAGATGHMEIETYTFDVLPPALRSRDVIDHIIQEFDWTAGRLS